jgi:glucose-6-phosphate isomerase
LQVIIRYASCLRELAPHIQQLHMENNRKSVSLSGDILPVPTGYIIFGEPGTNAQNSFFQLAHQPSPSLSILLALSDRLKTFHYPNPKA